MVQPCDARTKAGVLSYVKVHAKEFEQIRIVERPAGGLEFCHVQRSFLANGETFLLVGASLGRTWDFDVQVPVSITLLIGQRKTYRIDDWTFGNPTGVRFEGEDRDFNQIFSETGCNSFEDFVRTELFFQEDTPCLRYSLGAPFRGTVEQCHNAPSKLLSFGTVNGLLTWAQALIKADQVFRDSGLLVNQLEDEQSRGVWGDPFARIAMDSVAEGLHYAILTQGYRDGDQPNLFLVIKPDGKATGVSVLKRGNYTCEQLRKWAASGVPEEILERKFSQPPYTLPSTVEIPGITSADYFEYSGMALSTGAPSRSPGTMHLRFEITEKGHRKKGPRSIEVFPAKVSGSAEIEGLGEFRVAGTAYQQTKLAPPDFKLTLMSTTLTLQMDLHQSDISVSGMMNSLAGPDFNAVFQGKAVRQGPADIFISDPG